METSGGQLKLLLSVYAVFLLVAGVVFFALPSATLTLYGAPPLSVLEGILAQSLGAVMVGLGVSCWVARSLAKHRGPLMLGLIVMSSLWTVVCVRAGVLIDGNWFFWAEGAGFGLVTSLLIAVWHGGAPAS